MAPRKEQAWSCHVVRVSTNQPFMPHVWVHGVPTGETPSRMDMSLTVLFKHEEFPLPMPQPSNYIKNR